MVFAQIDEVSVLAFSPDSVLVKDVLNHDRSQLLLPGRRPGIRESAPAAAHPAKAMTEMPDIREKSRLRERLLPVIMFLSGSIDFLLIFSVYYMHAGMSKKT